MPRGIGYGKKPRGRGRAIRGGGPPERLPSGSLPKRGRMPSPRQRPQGYAPAVRAARESRASGREGGRGRAAIAKQGMPGPGGRQLQRRVQSGAISQEQAQKTMKQRQTLQKAFGKDWRTKVFGDRGYMQRTRTSLAKDKDNPKLAALNKKLMERRKTMLATARKRNKGKDKE